MNLDPATKNYIDAAIQVAIQDSDQRHAEAMANALQRLNDYEQRIATGEAIIRGLERKLEIDPAYQITKAKLIALAKELGI